MHGDKVYYFSNLNLKDDDVIIMTVDPDQIEINTVAEDFERIENMFKPHKVIAVLKGITILKEDKKRLIEMLQRDNELVFD
jgi:hypothetical protein